MKKGEEKISQREENIWRFEASEFMEKREQVYWQDWLADCPSRMDETLRRRPSLNKTGPEAAIETITLFTDCRELATKSWM